MATVLDKDLQRESTLTSNDRNIMVTLGSDQTIKFKLKGLKTGEVSINILDLWNQLNGIVNEPESDNDKPKSLVIEKDDEEQKVSKDNPMISINDIRTRFCTSFPAEMITKIDPIINEFLEEHKKKLKAEADAKKLKKK